MSDDRRALARRPLLALALLLAALLACDLPQLLPKPTAAPTAPEPPTVPVPTAAEPATSAAPTAATTSTAPPTSAVSPAPTRPTSEGPDSAGPAKDPCGLPGVQLRANFFSATGTSALTAPFSGDVTILKTPGRPNIFSIQQASVQRKFVILLKNLNPATYNLTSTYMSYTEKVSGDPNPRIWQATSGFLQVGPCEGGGTALRTVSDAAGTIGDSVLFQPQPGGHNAASGDMLIGVGARIQ